MIKKLLSATILAACISIGNAQNFSLVYNFSAVTQASAGATNSVDPTPPPTAPGVSGSSFLAVNTGTGSTGGGRFSFTGWPMGAVPSDDNYASHTGAIDLTKYYEVTVSPTPGYELTFNTMSVRIQRSGTGIRTYAVRGSVDNFGANLPGAVTSGTVITLQSGDIFFWSKDATTSGQNGTQINFPSSYTAITSPTTLRFYGWNAEGTGGTFSIDSVHIMGNASLSTGLGKLTHDVSAKFKLYPNPSVDGIVTIEAASSLATKVEVVNILGAVVAQSGLNNEKAKLDLSVLPQGTYFVRVKAGDKTSVEKLVISK